MITISHKLLKDLIGGVLFSTKTPGISGEVLVHVSMASTNGILSFTTCDGYRISQRSTLYNTEDFNIVLNVDGVKAVYKQLSSNQYDYIDINPDAGTFDFFGYRVRVDILPLEYINPDKYVPATREAQAWIELNPKQLLCLLPKPAKKQQHLTLRLGVDPECLGLSIPSIFGLNFDMSYVKKPQNEILNTLNYLHFYQALNTFKAEDKINIKFFEGYRGLSICGDNEYYWVLPVRGITNET